jgi:hypothetical protein
VAGAQQEGFGQQWSWHPPQLFLDFLAFPQPLLQQLSWQQDFGAQQVAGAQQVGLQQVWGQHWLWQQSPHPPQLLFLLFLHFLALPQPLLQQLSWQQDLGAQQLLAAGAQQLGAAAAGAQQLGAALQQAGAGAQQLAGAQQVAGQQLPARRKPKAFASEPAAMIKAAAVKVIHFMSVFS